MHTARLVYSVPMNKDRDYSLLIALLVVGVVVFYLDHQQGGPLMTEIQNFLRRNGF